MAEEHKKKHTEVLVPVVGTINVDTGETDIPDSFFNWLQMIEKGVRAQQGKQIFVNCSKCGKAMIVREKRWTGLCDSCKGIPREDERPDLDIVDVPSMLLEEIRHKILQDAMVADCVQRWNKSGDIADVSIIQRDKEYGDLVYLYKAPSHLPHMFVWIDQDYNPLQCQNCL